MEAEVITILNKLPRKDSITGMDIWYRFMPHINNNIKVAYKKDVIENVSGTTVSMGEKFTILLPFNDSYLPYDEWKNNPDAGFTISPGDYIIIGEVTEDVTPNNIQQIKNKYEPNVCEVRVVNEVIKRAGVNYQFKIEGV